MSDYFAALMRASGLSQTPGTAASAGTELSVLDLEIPLPAAPVSRAPHPQAARTETPWHAATSPAQAAATVVQPGPEKSSVTESPTGDLASAAIASPQPAPAQPESPASEPLVAHQALVQSVMRWVAGDQPAQSMASAQERPSTSATPALPGERLLTQASQPAAQVVSTTTVARVESVETAPQADRQSPAQPAPLAPSVRHELGLLPQSAAALREQPEPEKGEPAAADGLSISIGAIHLRVEAPAAPRQPQATSKPAVPPATRATTGTPTPSTRSSLSRRALRRI